MLRVRSVEIRKGFVVSLELTDGTRREIDLEPYLKGPVFDGIRSQPALFRGVKVQFGTLVWPDGTDIAPETLVHGLPPTPYPAS